jgi:hypothetical protein
MPTRVRMAFCPPHPKPFVWTAKAEEIIAKVQRGRAALNAIAS